jgi:hypothetical protein
MPFEEALQHTTRGEIVGCNRCGTALFICWLKAGDAQELDERCQALLRNPELVTMVDRVPILSLWNMVAAHQGLSAIPESCKKQFNQSDLEKVDQFVRAYNKIVQASEQVSPQPQDEVCPERTLFPWPPPVATTSSTFDYQQLRLHRDFKGSSRCPRLINI